MAKKVVPAKKVVIKKNNFRKCKPTFTSFRKNKLIRT
jgi:hypothetical protein